MAGGLRSAPLAAGASDWQYSGAERIVAVSDIHGAYEPLVATLRNAGVVNADLGWAGGATHLVIVGDILDRGPDSRDAMDLLMRLEGEAEAAGGMVHVLIGNHEAMNLVGDLRYVSREEFADFADEESDEERAQWMDLPLATRRQVIERAEKGEDDLGLPVEEQRASASA